jgi:Uncharacterised nucleotidyltransferase
MNVLLLDLLIDPELSRQFEPAQWDVVIPQARATGLLSSLGMLLEERGLSSHVPIEIRRHMDSVTWTHRKQVECLEYEIMWLLRAMEEAGQKLILLKGAAYIMAGLPCAPGRIISDLDLLVPANKLTAVETTLQDYGWESDDEDSYDEHYYRQWMHEIPPMVHAERESVLDVHHTILPPTSDEKLDADKLFENLLEVRPGIFVLSPMDMVLHSATHLFHEGQFNKGLRDLLDLDRLLRKFSAGDDRFWDTLLERAIELDMTNSVYLALRYTQLFLRTPVPEHISQSLEQKKRVFPGNTIMDFLFIRAFLPVHRSCTRPFTGFAELCLYIRSHYLRMPLSLLLPHLFRKARRRVFDKVQAVTDLKLENPGT